MGAKHGKYAMGLGLRGVDRPQSLVLRLGQTPESQQLQGRKGRAQAPGLSDPLSRFSSCLRAGAEGSRKHYLLDLFASCKHNQPFLGISSKINGLIPLPLTQKEKFPLTSSAEARELPDHRQGIDTWRSLPTFFLVQGLGFAYRSPPEPSLWMRQHRRAEKSKACCGRRGAFPCHACLEDK